MSVCCVPIRAGVHVSLQTYGGKRIDLWSQSSPLSLYGGPGDQTKIIRLTHRCLYSLNHLAHLVSGFEGASAWVDLGVTCRENPVTSALSLGLRCLSQPAEDDMPVFSFPRTLSSVCNGKCFNIMPSNLSHTSNLVRLGTMSRTALGTQEEN